ncbi:Transmembrane E3 ubiquitin-protein ligase fly2 [Orobanche gracilis]
MGLMKSWNFLSILVRILFGMWFVFVVTWPVNGLRPLRQRSRSWGDEWHPLGKEENELGAFSSWNLTGTYRGNWKFLQSRSSSSKFSDFRKSNGNSILELISTPTKITGVHYVQAGKERVNGQEDDYLLSTPYHLRAKIGVFSSQVFQASPRDKIWKRKNSPIYEIEKHCNIEIAAQISRVSSRENGGDQDKYYLEGLMDSPSVDDDVDCFSPMVLNATSVNTDVYYNFGTAKVSLLMIGHQAIMDAYICLLHLTAGILVESLFNAFATAAFFKFVVFSIFEMRYLLAIWKANRPLNGENWDSTRRELSALYSRFYAVLLGGILIMYEFHKLLRFILLLLHSFWIPQICINIARDSRKPLHPHYILGMTITRIAIPLYVFGCPHNFMRIEPDWNWCICLALFMGLQVCILLLQHYFGARCFIPHKILPEKYSYYRRFHNQGTNQAVDCVICMTTIELSQRSNDCDTVRSFLSPELSSKVDGH